jgi:hypothetical protein
MRMRFLDKQFLSIAINLSTAISYENSNTANERVSQDLKCEEIDSFFLLVIAAITELTIASAWDTPLCWQVVDVRAWNVPQ